MDLHKFRVGDTVTVGNRGVVGKVIDIVKPLETYEIFKIQSYHDGSIHSAAHHELVKGLRDDEFDFFEISDDDFRQLLDIDTIGVPTNVVETEISHTVTSENPTRTSETAPPQTAATNRFVDITDAEVCQFVFDNENINTRKKTLCNIKLFQLFLSEQNEERMVHELPPSELDKYLARFFVSVRQKDGREYQPSYLRGILGSLERHLKRHKYGTSLVTCHEFSNAREALKSKQKDLKKQGLGNKPKTADAINENEINELYNQQQLGNATPASLLNTIWLNNTLHFGIRAGGEEHRSLCFGDLKLCFDQELKAEYLVFN